MTAFRPIFQDHVSLALADGLFVVFAKDCYDAEKRIDKWMKKLDFKDKQYFTGCQYPDLYDVYQYPVAEEGVLIF